MLQPNKTKQEEAKNPQPRCFVIQPPAGTSPLGHEPWNLILFFNFEYFHPGCSIREQPQAAGREAMEAAQAPGSGCRRGPGRTRLPPGATRPQARVPDRKSVV